MSYKLGDEAQCKMCNDTIRYVGPYWEHLGELQPRHPAWPKLDKGGDSLLGNKSVESLAHFECPTCRGWFSIGDAPENRSEWACPWCYTVNGYDIAKRTGK